ncbi:NLR family CARD domain-containing protein 4-like [Branchiostoma floridae]|uniref:NLR family CARD domain-containing protein 4-like n=1 Tax=Branchiostoma floridae TaxID=7739 RepID=A0A9J7MCE5_BRAFL|nr:NLR family CARD domain-containing protein 4-like [Branchiostoma floridae]
MEVKDLTQGVSQRQMKRLVEEVHDNQRAGTTSKVQKCADTSHSAERMRQDPSETIEDLIRNNYTLLRKRLQVEKLIPHFIVRRLLDFPEDKQVTMSKTTTPDKAEALLELLTQKGTCTPEEFVEILKKGDHRHVADQLKRTSTESKTTKRPSDVADDVIACLKDLYATEYAHVRPLPWCEDLNLHLGEVYTNLQLQRRDDRGHFQETDTIVSLADIYNTRADEGSQGNVRSGVRKIRVEGDPGIGKSCSCQKLAYDWSCGKLDRFKVVFFLEMRHLTGKVKDEIFEQLLPKDTKTTPGQLWSYIQENQDDVLFILDGLDELSQTAREVTDVVDLIQGKILRNCHVLATSRPYQCVKDLEKCHQFYKIVGYSEENSKEFIHKYFCESPESASKLIKQLQSNSSLLRIVINPLNNVLICVVWEENNKEMPSSKDELYEMIVHSVAKRFCTKTNITMEGDKRPPVIEEALKDLEKLSWEGLEQEQLQFKIDEIAKKYGTTADNMLNMGLLTRDYSFSRIKRTCYCAFLHKTFQEYLAARYISGLIIDRSSREEGMKCVCRLFGMSDAAVVNSKLIVTCYREYREVQNWLLLILGENSRPLFEKFAEELSKAQTDEDRELLSSLCTMWLGTTFAGGKMAEIVATCMSHHATNKLDDFGFNGEDLRFYPDDRAYWCVGLAHVLTCQKKLPTSHGTSFIRHLTIDCDLLDAAQEKLGVLENALSDYDAMRSVTLLGIENVDPCSLLRTYIPRCGTESVIIRSKGGVMTLLLLSMLEQLLSVPRIEHVNAHVQSTWVMNIGNNLGERDIGFSFDRLLARLVESHTCLRSLKLGISSCMALLCTDSGAKIFSNLTETLQSISEHTRLEVVEFELPGNENQHETFDAGPMVHTLTECVKKNQVLKTLRLWWGSEFDLFTPFNIYHGDCSDESLSSLCSAIRENRTLETLVVEGLFFHSECRAEMISDLVRNKPSNYKELSITLSVAVSIYVDDVEDISVDDDDDISDDHDTSEGTQNVCPSPEPNAGPGSSSLL